MLPEPLTPEQIESAADELLQVAADKYRTALRGLVLFTRLAASHGQPVGHIARVTGLDCEQVATLINQGEL